MRLPLRMPLPLPLPMPRMLLPLLLVSTAAAALLRAPHPTMMSGGLKQPRPSAPFDASKATPVAPTLPAGSRLPKLVVFDLDNTVWTPELYTLRQLPNYASAGAPGPVAGQDVWLLDGAAAAPHELATCELWSESRVGVASRTNKGAWAHKLLQTFDIPGCPGRTLSELMAGAIMVYPGSKVSHFEQLRACTGVAYEEMLFFDDAADGKYGNCMPVSKLGVLSAYCPDGLTTDIWRRSLEEYSRRAAANLPTGIVLRPSGGGGGGGDVPSTAVPARIVKFLDAKGFGFVQIRGESSLDQVFFHQSKLGEALRSKLDGAPSGDGMVGLDVTVTIARDRRGRLECTSVRLSGGGSTDDSLADGVMLRCFSMNMPFAGLLARGVKSIESRNGTMFEGVGEGSIALLHVGKRTYPDGGKHRQILGRGISGEAAIDGKPLDEAEIDELTSLPRGFERGQVSA